MVKNIAFAIYKLYDIYIIKGCVKSAGPFGF